MTPTSATGRAKRAGFTLVELLITVAIIGLAASAVVLAMPDPRLAVGAEAERLAARLSAARDEAVLTNRPVAVEATAAGYGFAAYDGSIWAPLAEGPFKAQRWEEGTAPSGPVESVRIVFDPTGTAEPATLTLTREGRARRVTVDGAGQVSIND